MDNRAQELAKNIVRNRKRIISHWEDIDYYRKYGVEHSKDEKYLIPHVDDLTRCQVRDICLTYPAWMTKQRKKIAAAKGPEKEELQKAYDIKAETFQRIKYMTDGD